MRHPSSFLARRSGAAVILAITAFASGCGGEPFEGLFGADGTSSSGGGQGGAGGESASTGQAGGPSTTTGTATTTTGGGAEDCLNGADDDGDGLADCADPDCDPGYECVKAAPPGWTGYFRTHTSPYASPSSPDCPDGSAPQTYFAGPAEDAQCSACTCGDWGGGSCGPPALSCYPGSTSCSGQGTDFTLPLLDGSCQKPNIGFTQTLSCQIVGPSVVNDGGGCPPSASQLVNPDPWSDLVNVCGSDLTGGGCDGGKVCVPRKSPGYESGVCIQQTGEVACPDGWSGVTHAYAGGTDSRACGECQCTASGAGCSGGEYTFYDLNQCQDGDKSVVPDSGCTNLSALLDFSSWSAQVTLPTIAGGACAPSGGAPAGATAPEEPLTICCH